MILALHLPPRMVYGLAYKNQYLMCESKYKQKLWFPRMVWWHMKLIWLEGAGLVIVSIIDIETHFVPHASAFAVWVIAFCFNMLFNTILHHHSGIRQLTPKHDTIFYIKCGLFLLGYLLSWSTAFSYSIYAVLCSSVAYALFSMAEYILVGCNSLFYFLLVWELSGGRFEFYVSHKCHLGSTRTDVLMT
ncbi:frag1/DRAM/Sfk1 family domain-containing protein [Ditylenchus destructor]|uniref:Frag1/DRAM/Sfk1 family domain-containing protein n=1 Tax=Ditylenchus destructor TaxID=166010 RepID=A0AAD4NEX7_9BILA|nr:frag1/DRAM/Sfk1 family domain-containing protein [Ditylenchus destructor]